MLEELEQTTELLLASYDEVKYGPDEAVLIGLLNERSFVVDTFTKDYITSENPNLGYYRDYLYTGILEHYTDPENALYAYMVGLWNTLHHKGEVLTEIPKEFFHFF